MKKGVTCNFAPTFLLVVATTTQQIQFNLDHSVLVVKCTITGENTINRHDFQPTEVGCGKAAFVTNSWFNQNLVAPFINTTTVNMCLSLI